MYIGCYRRSVFAVLLLFLLVLSANAQTRPIAFDNQKYESSTLLASLQRLKVCASVMYLAAHPDDENTRLIAWLANERKYHTVYLSLTRGDGGQNLIGKEQGEAIGLIRTQELLQARNIDGGKQWFTRAYDFGYSKSPEESFKLWNREQVLADVVWAMRLHRPDVIFCRFPEDGRGGHGHHTASALLAREAFKLAGDSSAFPEQLKQVQVWQPKRLFWNAWVSPGQDPDLEMVKRMLSVDVGEYNPLLGKSMTELAGASRSMHKSQGFGASQPVGSRLDLLELLEGTAAKSDFMEGISSSWKRVQGAGFAEPAIDKIIQQFQPSAPEKSLGALATLYRKLEALPSGFYRDLKLEEIGHLMLRCAGIKAEFLSTEDTWIPGENSSFSFQVTNRSGAEVKILKVQAPSLGIDTAFSTALTRNIPLTWSGTRVLNKKTPISQPLWLQNPREGALFGAVAPQDLGKPEGSSPIQAHVLLELAGLSLNLQIEAQHKFTDPVKGELAQRTAVVPVVTVQGSQQVLLPDGQGKIVVQMLLSNKGKSPVTGQYLLLDEASNKQVYVFPKAITLDSGKTFVQRDTLSLNFGTGKSSLALRPVFIAQEDTFMNRMMEVAYDHIGKHYLFMPCKLTVLAERPTCSIQQVGYLKGPGDEVAEGLKAMGLKVEELDPVQLPDVSKLAQLQAIVVGVRAYNTTPELAEWKDALIRFAEGGGTVLVQYQTSRGLVSDLPFPYTLELGRGRVTEEDATVTYTGEASKVLNQPNRLSEQDWQTWVQERGLYYGQRWDDRILAPLSMKDSGEKEQKGALLVLPYGKGHMIYTGLSLFRQIPAGVPGAYRLLANLLSISHSQP